MNSENSKCIVCDRYFQVGLRSSENLGTSCHKIFTIFCKYFYLSSPQLENDEVFIPFCEKCTNLIETLCSAQEQLDNIQREITKIVANVSSIIIQSASTSDTTPNPCFKLHTVDDSVVEIVRDEDYHSRVDTKEDESDEGTISRVRKIICQRYSPRVMLKDFMQNAISVEIQVSDPIQCSTLQSLEATNPSTISFAEGPTLIYIGDHNTVNISDLNQVQHGLAANDYQVYEIETNYEDDTIENTNLLSTEQDFDDDQEGVKSSSIIQQPESSKENDNVSQTLQEKELNVEVSKDKCESRSLQKTSSITNNRKRKQSSQLNSSERKMRKQASVVKSDDGDKFIYDGKWNFIENDTGFQCCHCQVVKPTRKVIVAHLRHHRIKESKWWSCKTCSKTFVSQRDLATHEKSCPTLQVKTSVIQVEDGKFVYGDKWYFERNETDTGEVKYTCCSCGIVKTTQRNMTMHMRCHRLKDSKQFTCNICGLARVTQRDLDKHQRACGNPKRVVEIEPGKFLFEGKWRFEAIEYGFKCCACGGVRVNRTSMLLHLRRHRGKESKNFFCKPCGRNFAFKQELLTHELNHSETKRRTTSVMYADKKFLYGGQWRYEQLPDGDFRCDTCLTTTKTRKKMTLHLLRNHADPQRFVCNYCGVSFSNSTIFKCHQATHTNDRNFQCEKCGNTFKTQSQLCSHKHSHEIWKCEICKKTLYSKLLLKEHTLAHSGIRAHKCTRCGREFQHRKGLRNHWKKHNDATDFHCDQPQCDMTFLQKREITKHLLTAHGGNDVCPTTTVDVAEIMPSIQEVVSIQAACEPLTN